MLRLILIASTLAVSHAVDYACFTGSSIYERVVKVCNQDMPDDPATVDGSPNAWFCSVTSIKELGKNAKRDPPYIWSCATANQCAATCTDVDDDSVPKCSGYYGNDDDNKEGTIISTEAGITVRTWCAPALNNDKKPNSIAWPSGTPMPAALTLDLPFFSSDDPSSAALRATPLWMVSMLAVGTAFLLWN